MGHPRTQAPGPNPSGLCMCGCGGTTALAKKSMARSGDVKDTPRRYIKGHHRVGRGRGVCGVEGCENPHMARGLCAKHYQREHRNVDYQRQWRAKNREHSRAYAREWYAKNAESERRNQTARKWGMTRDEYEAFVARGCALCGATDKIVVEHCHKTGEIRDAVCQRCNVGMGCFGDDAERLREAAEYIEAHARGEVYRDRIPNRVEREGAFSGDGSLSLDSGGA